LLISVAAGINAAGDAGIEVNRNHSQQPIAMEVQKPLPCRGVTDGGGVEQLARKLSTLNGAQSERVPISTTWSPVSRQTSPNASAEVKRTQR
jgi:hypothetical protein